VKRALEDLVEIGVLIAYRATSTTGYGYTSDRKLITEIGRFLKKARK